MLADLHLYLLRDWILCGSTQEERAIRCRLAIKAVAAEDLVGSALLETLQWARTAYYLYNTGLLPVVRSHVPLLHDDGSITLIQEDSQRDPHAQALIDNFAAEQEAHLQHAFLIPLGDSPAARYQDPVAMLMGPPTLRRAQDVEVTVEEDLPPSPPAPAPARSAPPAAQPPPALDPEIGASSDPDAALPVEDPEEVHGHGSSGRPAPGSAIDELAADLLRASTPFGQRLGTSNPAAPRQAAAQQLPHSHASRMSQRSRRTVTTRQFTRVNHPMWRQVRANCSKAGEIQVPRIFPARHPGQLENAPLFARFITDYAQRLEHPAVPHVESTYMGFLMWHPLNKPSADLEHIIFTLSPDDKPNPRSDPLGALHAWDVKFYEYLDTVEPWTTWLPADKIVQVYTTGLRKIHRACHDKLAPGWSMWDLEPVRIRTARARESMHAAVQQTVTWQEDETRISRQQIADKPAPVPSRLRDATVDKPTHQRQSAPQRQQQQLHLAATPQQAPRPRSTVAFADDGHRSASPGRGPSSYQDRDGVTWHRADSHAYVTKATPRPDTLPPPKPLQPPRTTNAFQSPGPHYPPRASPRRCSTCGQGHDDGNCPVLYPDKAPPWWKGTPRGDYSLYCQYVNNARKAGIPDRLLRHYRDADDNLIEPGQAVPTPPPRANTVSSQDTRARSPASQRTANANAAMSLAVEDDPVTDSMQRYAFSSLRSGLPSFADNQQGDDLYSLRGHYPTPAEMGRFQDECAAREGRLPSAAESGQHRICLATTRAQAAREEINAQRRAAAAAAAPAHPAGTSAPVIMPGSVPAAPAGYPATPLSMPPPVAEAPPGFSTAAPHMPAAAPGAPPGLPAPIPALLPPTAVSPVDAHLVEPSVPVATSQTGSTPHAPAATPTTQQRAIRQHSGPADRDLIKATRAAARAAAAGALSSAAAAGARPMATAPPRAARVSATGRYQPPTPYTADPVDPHTPPSQLPNAQRRGRRGYAADGQPLLTSVRFAGPLNSPRAPQHLPAPALVPALPSSPPLSSRFAIIQPDWPTASAQYLMSQGPGLTEQAMASKGGIMFSFQDQLFFVPMSDIVLGMPDATSQRAGAQSVPALPLLPDNYLSLPYPNQTIMPSPIVYSEPQFQPALGPPASGSAAVLATPAPRPPVAVPPAPAAPAPRPPVAVPPAPAATAPRPPVAVPSAPAATAPRPPTPLPAAAPVSTNTTPAAPPATAVRTAPERSLAEVVQWGPSCPPDIMHRPQRSLPPRMAVAGRAFTQAALAARRASLDAHGIAGEVPLCTPVKLLPDAIPESYLFIQELHSKRPANIWKVAIFDTGADVALCSQDFAERNELPYGIDPITVNTANGDSTTTLGELCQPLEFILARNSDHPCRAVSTVQVMPGVSKLFDLIISVEIITQWTAHICCATSQLVYYPNFWTKQSLDSPQVIPVLMKHEDIITE